MTAKKPWKPPWIDDAPIGNRARLEACPHCGSLVIRALDAPTAALDTRLEPIPLQPAGELLALLQGLRTYNLIPAGRTHEISHRNHWDMTPDQKHPVLAQHQCPGQIPTSAMNTIHNTFTKKKKASTNEPPF